MFSEDFSQVSLYMCNNTCVEVKEFNFRFAIAIYVCNSCMICFNTIENVISNELSLRGVEKSFFFRCYNYADAWSTRYEASRTTGSDRNDAVNEYFRADVTE